MTVHPFLDTRLCGQRGLAVPRELAEQLQHVVEEKRLGTAGAIGDGEPDKLDGVTGSDLAAQIQILEFAAGVVDVVQNADRSEILPAQCLQRFAVVMLVLIETHSSRIRLQFAKDPVAHADERLGVVPGIRHDLFELGILPQQLLKKLMRLHTDGDLVESPLLFHDCRFSRYRTVTDSLADTRTTANRLRQWRMRRASPSPCQTRRAGCRTASSRGCNSGWAGQACHRP